MRLRSQSIPPFQSQLDRPDGISHSAAFQDRAAAAILWPPDLRIELDRHQLGQNVQHWQFTLMTWSAQKGSRSSTIQRAPLFLVCRLQRSGLAGRPILGCLDPTLDPGRRDRLRCLELRGQSFGIGSCKCRHARDAKALQLGLYRWANALDHGQVISLIFVRACADLAA